jgi:hypothetical protein
MKNEKIKVARALYPVAFRWLVLLPLGMVLVCCVRHAPHNDSFPSTDRSYLDLQLGWRVRTVTPLLKSGKYVPEFKSSKNANGVVELSSGNDLLGYETSDYSVVSGEGGGVKLIFSSAENFIDGKASPQSQPRVHLLDFPPSAKFIRIVFLTRVSSSDHNQAILAATSLATLDALTQQVEADPSENCKSEGETRCVWVPQGIAVRAEKRDPVHHKSWIPAM